MAKNTTGNAHITITVNGAEAINFYNKLKKEEKELSVLAKQGDKESEKRLHNLQGMLTDVNKELMKVDDVLKGGFANLATLEKMAKRVKEQMRYAQSEKELKNLQIQYRGLTDRIRELTNSTQSASNAFGRLFKRALEYTSFYMILNRGRAVLQNAIQGNLKLSDSISDIQKVSGLSEEGVKGLVTQIERLDSRNSPEVLNNMAYAAGKLGIKGTENLLGFTRAADKLNVALKEYLGEGADGVVRLMKFANVMGTTQKYGVEQALLKTGSALNFMTQSTAAAADYMIEFAGRFGPIARQAKMTEGDVIGLASALDALTVNNEEAATSLQKFTVKLLSNPTTVAKALGLDAASAREMVETGKSMQLIELAFSKLAERAEKYGVSGISSVIGDLGAKGQAQRLVKTLATLSNNTQMVHDYVLMANQAFAEGTSVTNEYNIKNQNAAAIMERMRNSWEKVFVNAEEVDAVKELATQLYNVSTGFQQSALMGNFFKGIVSALCEVLVFAINTLKFLSPLLVGLMSIRLVNTIGGWVMAFGAWAKSAYAAAVAATGASRAMANLKAALIQTGWGAIGIVIGIALNELMKWISANQEAAKKTKELNDKIKNLSSNMSDFNTELYKEQRSMEDLFARTKAANAKTGERQALIAQINTKYGKYLDNLLTEKSTVDEITKAQNQANNALRQNIALKIKQGKLDEARELFAEQSATGLENFRAGAEKARISTEDIYKAQTQIQELLTKNYGKPGYGGPNEAATTILKELAKTDNRWNEILNNRNDVGSVYDFMRDAKKRGLDYYGSSDADQARRTAAYKAEQEMVAANRRTFSGISTYIASIIQERNVERKINDRYNPIIGDYVPPVEDTGGAGGRTTTIEPEDPEVKKTQLRELKLLKEETQAVKAELSAFYEWRAAEINKMAENGLITPDEKAVQLSMNKARKATTEINAWRMALGEDKGGEIWKEQLEVMKGEIINGNADMQKTLDHIANIDMVAFGNRLRAFGQTEIDGMRKTMATDADIISKESVKMTEAWTKALDQYDLQQKVRAKYIETLTQLGLFNLKFEEGVEQGMQDANKIAREGINELFAMYEKLFTLDYDAKTGKLTEKGVEQFKTMLGGMQNLSYDTAAMSNDQTQVLFTKAMELGEQMTNSNETMRKREKRDIDARYQRTDEYKNMQTDLKQTEMLNKTTDTISSKWGTQSTVATQDEEIMLYSLRLQAATDYYNELARMNADEKTLEEQRQVVLQNTLNLEEKLGGKMTELQQFFADSMNTLPEFGTALGEAFAKTNPEEREEAFKNALKGMVSSLGDATKKMILEWVKQRIQHAIQQKLMNQDTAQASQERFNATTTAEGAITSAMGALGQQMLTTKKAQNAEVLSNEAAATTGKVNMGIASGAAKTIGDLGWWGVPLVAVITALLNGLLSWALGSLFKSKDNSNDVTSTPQSSANQAKNSMRLVKGMLTYDKGNVQSFEQAQEGGSYTVLGNDGKVYSARKQSELKTGIVRHPIATLVNGQPSLVAEKGAEMIIGRQTLKDMSQFRPDLLQQIIGFNKKSRGGFRMYDEGNIEDFMQLPTPAPNNNEAIMNMLTENHSVNEQTLEVLQALTIQLEKGIKANINKYGKGGLVEEVADGFYVTKVKRTNTNINRLFG